MNRRPSKSRSEYDAFSSEHVRHFFASSPDHRFFDEQRKRSPFRTALLIGLIILVIFLVINHIVNLFVFVRHAEVPITGLFEAYDGLRILQISDLKGARFGKKQSRIRSALAREVFDIVLITGDMVSSLGNAEPFYELLEVLSELQPNAPVYFISGDADPDPVSMTYASGGSPFAPWILGARQRGAIYLGAPQSIGNEEQRIWFLSLTQATLDVNQLYSQYEERLKMARAGGDENAIELAEFQLQCIQETAAMRSYLTENDITIVLTHVPNTEIINISCIPPTRSYPIDAILCGHYLNGLLRLPGIGAAFVPTDTLPNYGLFPGKSFLDYPAQIGKTWIIPSGGLGVDRDIFPFFFFRLLNPPTVNLLTLTSSSL